MKLRFVAVGLFCLVPILLWATGVGPLAADVFLLVVDKLRSPTATLTTSTGAGYCREVYFTKGWGFPIDSDHPKNDLQDEAAVSFVFRATKSKDRILIALRRSSNSLNQYSLRLDGNENPRLVSQSEWRDATEILTPRGFWLDPPPAEVQLDKFYFRSPDGRFAASGGYSGITQPGWFGDGRKGTMTVDLLQEGSGAKLVTMRGNFRKTGPWALLGSATWISDRHFAVLNRRDQSRMLLCNVDKEAQGPPVLDKVPAQTELIGFVDRSVDANEPPGLSAVVRMAASAAVQWRVTDVFKSQVIGTRMSTYAPSMRRARLRTGKKWGRGELRAMKLPGP